MEEKYFLSVGLSVGLYLGQLFAAQLVEENN